MGRQNARAWIAAALAGGGAVLLATAGGARAAAGDPRAAPAGDPVQAGVNAWSAGDFATAVTLWRGPAARGDADAEFDLGQAYKLGRGVPQDLAKAEALFQRAAAQGHLEAADNYGLLVFQRGDHAAAMPYIRAAADRGNPGAQYVLGIVLFNGEGVPTDWVRAYALESLSQQAGWPPAKAALAKMDGYIPLEQRQQAVGLAADLAADAEATRNRQMASADLRAVGGGAARPANAGQRAMASDGLTSGATPGVHPGPAPRLATATAPAGPAGGGRADDGDMAAPRAGAMAGAPAAAPRRIAAGLPPAPTIRPRGGAPARPAPMPGLADADTDAARDIAPVAAHPAASARPPLTHPAPPRVAETAPAPGGGWKIQLGAFGIAANAEALWAKVHALPAVAGHPRQLVPTGKVNRLMATGFSAEGAAAACRALTGAGYACIATRD